jgi:hypothetical protein
VTVWVSRPGRPECAGAGRFHLGAEQQVDARHGHGVLVLGIDTHAHQHDHRAGLIGNRGQRLGQGAGLADRGQRLAHIGDQHARAEREGRVGRIGRGAHDADHGGRERGDRAGAIGKKIGLDAVQHGALLIRRRDG